MNSKLILLTIWLAGVCAGFCQRPPNDDFANRIQLTGNDVTFTGNLTGATIETNEWADCLCWPYTHGYYPVSVWWSWTATNSTQVHIVALSYSQEAHGTDGMLAVYPGTNVFGTYPASFIWLDSGRDKLTLSFQAEAGTSYQIQFCGELTTLAVTFELLATNAPLILQPPSDQTGLTNGAALFMVVAAGLPPLHYQWRFNGSDLPGANDPMLAFDSLSPGLAGDYTVAVSNSTGFAVSSPARLNVNTTAGRPLLRAVALSGSNSFSFALNGESGRYYRIESSTDLRSWQPESAFPNRSPIVTNPPTATTYGSVVFAASSNVLFTIPRTAGAKFLRASVYTAPNEICNNHLKLIRFAKDLWARNTQQAWGAYPTELDLIPFYANLDQVSCPLVGGTLADSYALNPVAWDPFCEVLPSSHFLEEPR